MSGERGRLSGRAYHMAGRGYRCAKCCDEIRDNAIRDNACRNPANKRTCEMSKLAKHVKRLKTQGTFCKTYPLQLLVFLGCLPGLSLSFARGKREHHSERFAHPMALVFQRSREARSAGVISGFIQVHLTGIGQCREHEASPCVPFVGKRRTPAKANIK